MSQELLKKVEESSIKETPLEFDVGDTVDVHCRILEGSKERIQIFNGVVIGRSGSGTREMFIVRRIVAGEGVERKFPTNSPRIAKVEVNAVLSYDVQNFTICEIVLVKLPDSKSDDLRKRNNSKFQQYVRPYILSNHELCPIMELVFQQSRRAILSRLVSVVNSRRQSS